MFALSHLFSNKANHSHSKSFSTKYAIPRATLLTNFRGEKFLRTQKFDFDRCEESNRREINRCLKAVIHFDRFVFSSIHE